MAPSTAPRGRRDLHIQQVEHDGQTLTLVQDPLGILGETLCLTEFAGTLFSVLDGVRTVEEVEAIFRPVGSASLPPGFIRARIEEMKRCGLLEDEVYWRRKREILEEYRRAMVRPPSHADGSTYPADPEMLRDWLEAILNSPEATGEWTGDAPRILVAPHIDFRVNTSVYASAYRTLRGHAYDRVILLGTGHSISEGLYCPTLKAYSSPLGATRTDTTATRRLLDAANGIAAPDDFPHRGEHALEFQLLFLQHLLGADAFELIPILCGSMQELVHRVTRLGKAPWVRPFLAALREIIEEEGKRTLVVAGVDFSHIGLRFSHEIPALEMLEETRRHDRTLVEALSAWDAEAFWETELRSGSHFNVCGFSTLSTILESMETPGAKCLAYDIWDDSPTGSAVTYAALVA